MKWLAWAWHELTRPRGHVKHRFYRIGRRSRAGVALLLVLTSLMFMTVIVTEISYGASVRLQLAAHQRDEAKAEALAYTGFQIYRLVLVASKGIGQAFGQYLQQFGLGGDALWQMIPFINTGMMRMLLVSGSDLDEEDMEEYNEEGLTEEQEAESRDEGQSSTRRNFLDFDGDFFAEVIDEDRKVYIGSFTATNQAELMAQRHAIELFALMSGEENDQWHYDNDIERWELIGDLADWTDVDNTRIYQGGHEDSLYQRLDDPYLPKNAPVDTMEEIRLINGWHRDDIWERYGDQITVYGKGTVNINTAEREVMLALLRTYVTPNTPDFLDMLISEINLYLSLANYPNGRSFVSHLESLGANVDPQLATAVKSESSIFRITSTGEVGEAVATVEAVVDFQDNRLGKIVYWRIE